MNDIQERAHDLALLYIRAEIDSGKLKLPTVDDFSSFVGHYMAQYNNFLSELQFYQ